MWWVWFVVQARIPGLAMGGDITGTPWGSQLCFWEGWGSDSLYGHSRSGSHGMEGWGIPTEADRLTPVLRVVGPAEGLGSRSGLCPSRLGPKHWDSGCQGCFWRVTV